MREWIRLNCFAVCKKVGKIKVTQSSRSEKSPNLGVRVESVEPFDSDCHSANEVATAPLGVGAIGVVKRDKQHGRSCRQIPIAGKNSG